MSFSEVISSAEGLEKMKTWASIPSTALALIQDDTIMGGLVLAMSNADQTIVATVLEILLLLSDVSEHRPLLKNSLGMMEQLDAILTSGTCGLSQAETARKLEQRLSLLTVPHNRSHHAHRHKSDAGKSKRRNSFFLGSVAKSRLIVLQIRGLNDRYDAEAARNSLLTVKGVISITSDLRAKRIILRTKPELKPELLAAAVARTMTMLAEQVIKDDDGNEVFVSFRSHDDSLDKQNELLPDYPDDTSPIHGDKNMARVGGATPGKDNSGLGFIKSVGSFLSNSFYW